MVAPVLSEKQFIELFERVGAQPMAQQLNMNVRAIHARRRAIERRIGRHLVSPNGSNRDRSVIVPEVHDARFKFAVTDGHVLIGSDAHYWPNRITTAHAAFVKFCEKFEPAAVILNGDILDGASISRHPPIGWEDRPHLVDEMEACKSRLQEIQDAARGARYIWTLGNHDARFETRLAMVAPEYAKIHGVHLKDHFPMWRPCWSTWINGDVVIKHRMRSGIHAAHLNTVNSGKTIITGHLHSLKVTPFDDYNGTRWGVDCGTLADPYGPQFRDYTEDGVLNWRSGFILLTFRNGRLMWPEVVSVIEPGKVDFRGEVIEV